MIERGWIRNATITQAMRHQSARGDGYIVCRTNFTGSNWIYMPKSYYQAIVNSFDPALTPIPKRVCDWLRGKSADVRVLHVIHEVSQEGALSHTWDARIHPRITPAMGSYRLGDGGHG